MNRLQNASSPYLRQHADNPVDWYEWGPEAFAEAERRDVPIFLSVGYSSCHWCHVMAHESFSDDDVAKVLNEHFVAVKVDREERPDVDAVYMEAVQALNSGHGGWPMSVFVTPDRTPFFAGTYWPKEDRQGMPGFLRVLEAVRHAWEHERERVVDSAGQLADHLRSGHDLGEAAERIDPEVAARAAQLCVRMWDDERGGFGRAPKFPQAMTIDFLLAHGQRTGDEAALRAAVHSLEMMARGGIYDHLAGGFARYSVDERWLVPHFEKMLYDNALLLRAYTHAWQVTGRPRFRRVAAETADYLLREMRHPDGGFYSATDADSEGVEGKFFVWTAEELDEVVAAVGEDPAEWRERFGVTDEGNWSDPHGHAPPRANILHEAVERDEADEAFTARFAKVRQALYHRRAERVPPGLDDKVLTSWNALALGALAEAGAVLGVPAYVEAASTCARFLRDTMVVGGQLRHTWTAQHGASVPAFLEDVAYLAQALLVLYEADFDPAWPSWAAQLAAEAESRFADGDTGAYFATAHDAEELVSRPRDMWDNATPAGASAMVDAHLRLGGLRGEARHWTLAERTLARFLSRAEQAPTGYGELLRGLERLLAGPLEVAVVGDPADDATRALVAAYRSRWLPGAVLAVADVEGGHPGDVGDGDAVPVPLLANRSRVDGRPAAYVCRSFTCERPVTEPAELVAALLGGGPSAEGPAATGG